MNKWESDVGSTVLAWPWGRVLSRESEGLQRQFYIEFTLNDIYNNIPPTLLGGETMNELICVHA